MSTKTTTVAKATTYRGMVVDKLAYGGRGIRYTSRPCVTWEEAQRRAEARARRQFEGDRYEVVVVAD